MKLENNEDLLLVKIYLEREQDGRGVGRRGGHLSPRIHQEYTFRHRSACRIPAESGQEYLTSGKEYINHAKLSRRKELGGRKNRDVSRTGPALAGGGTKAEVQSPYRGNCLSQRRNI